MTLIIILTCLVLGVTNIVQATQISKLNSKATRLEGHVLELQIDKLYRDHPATRRRGANAEGNF